MKKAMNVMSQAPLRRRWLLVMLAAAVLTGVPTSAASAGAAPVVQSTSSRAGAQLPRSGSAPRITTPSNWQFTAGVYSVFTVTAAGSPTPTLRVSGTPPFLFARVTDWGAVVFFGDTPTNAAGRSYTVEITASNGIAPNAYQQLVMMAGTTTTTTSVSASPSPAVAGQPVTYTAKVAPVPNGGTVTVRANGSAIPGCINIPVNTATGTATCSSTWLTAGTYDLLTEYSGYRLFLWSYGPGSFRLVINPRAPAYWLATTNGRVFGLGTAPSLGHANTSAGRAIAGTRSGKGYYVAGAGGGVFTFGDARFYGSVPALGKRVSNIVAIVPTSDDRGYYLVGSDGGIFTFGDARFYGSLPGIGIRTQHVVGMVAYPAGTGYLLVGRDGGVFTFGNAKFYGSLPGIGIRVTSIRGILPASAGTGYVLVGADGGVFNFGTGVKFYGSLPGIGVRVSNIVGIALTQDEDGYYMAGSDGRVYGFGSAKAAPAPSGLQANLPVAAIAGIPVPPPTIGFAQRIFQGVQHFAASDRFERTSVNVIPDPPRGYPESSVGFRCLSCGAGQPFPYAFTILWYGSHDAAVGDAVTSIKIAQSITPGQAYAPQYVAGTALMAPSAPTPWPPPERIVRAFGQAVGQPVVTVQLPYGP